ncbi:hypothetical protein FKM82_030523 [Ascaphus truei]
MEPETAAALITLQPGIQEAEPAPEGDGHGEGEGAHRVNDEGLGLGDAGGIVPTVPIVPVTTGLANPGLTALLASWGEGATADERIRMLAALHGQVSPHSVNGEKAAPQVNHHSFNMFVCGTDRLSIRL